MVAGPLVAQGAVDDDKIGRRSGRHDLAGRGDAEQQTAAAREQFFRDQDRERSADRAADNADDLAGQIRIHRVGYGSRATLERLRSAFLAQPPHDIAVGIEDADRRHVDGGHPFCRRASRNSAAGRNTEGADGFLLSRIAVIAQTRSNMAP